MSASQRWAAYARDPQSLNAIHRLGPVGLGVLALALGVGYAALMTVAMALLVTPRAGLTGDLVLTSALEGLLYGPAMVAFFVRARRKTRLVDGDRRPLVSQLVQAWRTRRVPERPLPGFRQEIEKTMRQSRLNVVLPVVLCLGLAVWFGVRASDTPDSTLSLLGWVMVGVLVLGLSVTLHLTLRNRRRTADLLAQLDQQNEHEGITS